jgi:hypothetical protein
MKKRYLYALLFGIPGFFVSGMIALFVFGGAIGILWIYVFGDNPWPVSTDTVLSALLVLVFLSLWIASIAVGYAIGKRLESDPVWNRTHILIFRRADVSVYPFYCPAAVERGKYRAEDRQCPMQ